MPESDHEAQYQIDISVVLVPFMHPHRNRGETR
jgi:hypothetical protein